jgi:hypothetical protein
MIRWREKDWERKEEQAKRVELKGCVRGLEAWRGRCKGMRWRVLTGAAETRDSRMMGWRGRRGNGVPGWERRFGRWIPMMQARREISTMWPTALSAGRLRAQAFFLKVN